MVSLAGLSGFFWDVRVHDCHFIVHFGVTLLYQFLAVPGATSYSHESLAVSGSVRGGPSFQVHNKGGHHV